MQLDQMGRLVLVFFDISLVEQVKVISCCFFGYVGVKQLCCETG